MIRKSPPSNLQNKQWSQPNSKRWPWKAVCLWISSYIRKAPIRSMRIMESYMPPLWISLISWATIINFTSYKCFRANLMLLNSFSSQDGVELACLASKLQSTFPMQIMPSWNTIESWETKLTEAIELLKWTTSLRIRNSRNRLNKRKRRPKMSLKLNLIWINQSRIWSDWFLIWRWWIIRWNRSVMMPKRCLLENWRKAVFWEDMRLLKD